MSGLKMTASIKSIPTKKQFKRLIKVPYRTSVLGCAFLTLSACQILDYNKPDGGLTPSGTPVTVDRVAKNDALAKLGASQHPRILQTYGGEYSDAKLERMVAKIVGKLTAVSENPNQTYRITILNSPNVNAFALPGGYVYVTRGMLALANDSSEVAAVLAHEMAHVTANHGILRQQKEAEVELTNQVVSEVLADRSVEKEAAIRGKLRLAQFSRNQELQADAIGIKMLGEAGYDPFASPRFLQSMEAYTAFRNVSGATDATLDFLASHPATPQRIQLAIGQARKVGAPGIGTTDRDDFLNGIDGMIFGDTADEGYIRGNQFVHPKLGVTFTVPQGFTIDNSSAAVIASGPGDIAIRFDGVALPRGLSASDYIQSGWVSGLDPASVQQTSINGLPAARARAVNDRWEFDVVVIVVKDRVFRFLTAAPRNSTNLASVSLATTSTFKALSSREVSALKPLRIHVVTVRAGETVSSMAQRMQGSTASEKLFRIINALSPTATLSAGDRVKIISE
ncbi:M48 family metalloprotease [Bartonella sp. LJL80]